jgi:hypothetical protein
MNSQELNFEMLAAFSDDESTPFQVKAAQPKQRKYSRYAIFLGAVGYIILGACYIGLRIEYKQLASRVEAVKPELFPSRSCFSATVDVSSDSMRSPGKSRCIS